MPDKEDLYDAAIDLYADDKFDEAIELYTRARSNRIRATPTLCTGW